MTALRRLWLRPAVRAVAWQGLALAALGALGLWVWGNVAANLPRMKLQLGFDFLSARAAFEIGDNLLGYRAGDTILFAFAAGLANTLQVAALGIVLTTILATLIALARLSRNLMLARAAWLYVETMRNIPLLLQLLFWHTFIVRALPGPRQAWTPLAGVFVSNRGVTFPTLDWQPALAWMLVAAAAGAALAVAWIRRARARRDATGVAPAVVLPTLALVALPPLLAWIAAGEPATVEVPALRGFNFVGGGNVSPEFVALLFALVTYQAGFAAETIRSGILGVPKGQIEAARSLGLSRPRMLRFVVLPQALRIVVPPLTSQYLSLTKNSSLAVAVGYPELVRVSSVVIGDTGRSVECIAIILLVYLSLSLATAALMNRYNARLGRDGR